MPGVNLKSNRDLPSLENSRSTTSSSTPLAQPRCGGGGKQSMEVHMQEEKGVDPQHPSNMHAKANGAVTAGGAVVFAS